jgi:hypothetical protein
MLPLVVAVAIVGAQHGQGRTDHLPTDHLAIKLPSTPTTNSTGRRHLGPTTHRTPTMPTGRHRATQHAQSMLRVPEHLHPA